MKTNILDKKVRWTIFILLGIIFTVVPMTPVWGYNHPLWGFVFLGVYILITAPFFKVVPGHEIYLIQNTLYNKMTSSKITEYHILRAGACPLILSPFGIESVEATLSMIRDVKITIKDLRVPLRIGTLVVSGNLTLRPDPNRPQQYVESGGKNPGDEVDRERFLREKFTDPAHRIIKDIMSFFTIDEVRDYKAAINSMICYALNPCIHWGPCGNPGDPDFHEGFYWEIQRLVKDDDVKKRILGMHDYFEALRLAQNRREHQYGVIVDSFDLGECDEPKNTDEARETEASMEIHRNTTARHLSFENLTKYDEHVRRLRESAYAAEAEGNISKKKAFLAEMERLQRQFDHVLQNIVQVEDGSVTRTKNETSYDASNPIIDGIIDIARIMKGDN